MTNQEITQEKKQQMIDEIMDSFEFEKVHKTMVALDWRWVGVEGVPDILAIRKFARNCLKYAFHYGLYGCGGFRATYKEGILALEFIVEAWGSLGYMGSH